MEFQPRTLNPKPFNPNKPIQVHVETYANLRQYSPEGQGNFDLTLVSGATVRSIIDSLSIPRTVKMVILVNGRHATEDTGLNDADKITLFPPMEGG